MSDHWFYADGEKIIGPISLEKLEHILSIVPEPHSLPIWKAGFSDWAVAGAVKEITALIRKPPPLPKAHRKQASEYEAPPLTAQNSTAGDKNSSSSVKRRWSLVRAAMWGLLVMGIVFAVKVL